MARKRITEQALGSWEEVNAALKKIGEAQLEIDLIEPDMNASISAVKEEAKEKVKKHEEDIKLQELMIQQYVTEHKDELNGKSLKLAFGMVGFRMSTKLILPKNVHTIIENLKKNGMLDCLNTKVTVNKDVLKTYDEKEIIKVGASLKKEDAFWYEVEKVSVQDS